MSCNLCDEKPEYKDKYGCEGRKAKSWVDIAGKTYSTCPLYPLLQDKSIIRLITEYNYFKLSHPTLTEVKAIPIMDLEMFDYIENIIVEFAEKRNKTKRA